MRVVIAGAHGKIARLLTGRLAGRATVIGLIRNPDHAAEIERDGGMAVLLDLEQAERGEIAELMVGAEDPPPDDDDHQGVFDVYLRAKAQADAAVRGSALDWTIVRPGRLTDDPPTGRVRIDTVPHRAEVPRADVAAVLDAVLEDPRAARAILYVNRGGDELTEALDKALG